MPKAVFEGYVKAIDMSQPKDRQTITFTFEITKAPADWKEMVSAFGWHPFEAPIKTISRTCMTFEAIEEADSSIPGPNTSSSSSSSNPRTLGEW